MHALKRKSNFTKFASIAFLIAFPELASDGARAEYPHRLAILQFQIEDNTLEAGAPQWHETSLQKLTKIVGATVSNAALYHVVPQSAVDEATAATDPGTALHQCNGCELDIARKVGADRVMVGWIYKMSLLVMALHVEIKDVETGTTVYRRVLDFRGDNEASWNRAATYMVRTLQETKDR